MVDSFAYWAIAIATIAGVAYVALGTFQWLRARHPERLRIGERFPEAIATAEGLPNAREIQREYCVTLLKKNAVSNLVLGAVIILTSSFAFFSLPPLKAAMAQISAVGGQDLDSFELPAFQLLLGLAIIAVGVCSHAGSLLAIGLLPRQPERNDSPLDHVIHGPSWRIVIVPLVPIIYLLAITLVFALSPIATHIYPPHIVAMNILRSHYLWISFAIPFALLFGALVSGLCVWSLHWLAPRRIVSDVSVSANADWSGRQDTIRYIVDDWQKLLLYPGFAQVFLLSIWFIPAFVDPFMDTSFGIIVTMTPLLLWGAWFLFLSERFLRGRSAPPNAVTVDSQ